MAIEKKAAGESDGLSSDEIQFLREQALKYAGLEKKLKEMEALDKQSKEDLTNSIYAQVAERIKNEAKFQPQISGTQNNNGPYVDPSQIDESDFDEIGVTFFHYGSGYVIVDDMRKGYKVTLPNQKDKIEFIYQSTKIIQRGRYPETSVLSTYTSHSKREQKWLRDFTFYGIKFFEDMKTATSVDAFVAQSLTKHMNSITMMEPQQVVALCRSNNLEVTSDIKDMKLALAYHLAKRDTMAEQQANLHRASQALEEKVFLESGKI